MLWMNVTVRWDILFDSCSIVPNSPLFLYGKIRKAKKIVKNRDNIYQYLEVGNSAATPLDHITFIHYLILLTDTPSSVKFHLCRG